MSSHNKYAVLDFETTGFGSLDRVVEVGVVLLDEHLEMEETWDSLIQPEREIPSTFIHKITDEDVVDAPQFSGIAERLASMLAGAPWLRTTLLLSSVSCARSLPVWVWCGRSMAIG